MDDSTYQKARVTRGDLSKIAYDLSDFEFLSLGDLIKQYLPEEEQNRIRADIKQRLEERLAELKKQFDEL